MSSFQLLSPSFSKNQAALALKFTGFGKDVSPALTWVNAPEKTKSFALIVDDPDCRTKKWNHLVMFNIPKEESSIAEGGCLSHSQTKPKEAKFGYNSWDTLAWRGPKPPSGSNVHHYYFKLYALDSKLNLEHPDQEQLEKAMKGKILGKCQLVGTFHSKGEE